MTEENRRDDEIIIFRWRIVFSILEDANRGAMKLGIPVCQYMEEAVAERNRLRKLKEEQDGATKAAASRDL